MLKNRRKQKNTAYIAGRKYSAINRIGYGMHGRPADEFFKKAWMRARELPEGRGGFAYLYGFICHFALDHSCHPYIEKKIKESGVTHAEIEVEFDRMLLLQDGLDPLRQSLTDHIHPSTNSACVIADFFPGVTARQIYHAERSFLFYNRLLIAPGSVKRNMIFSLLHLTGNYTEMHGLVVNRQPNPLCKDSNQMLTRLYVRAIPEARHLIETWLDTAAGRCPWDDLYRYTFGSKYVPREEEQR